MFTLQHAVNGISQLEQPYHDRDDACRKANELLGQRKAMASRLGVPPSQCSIEFKILGDDGTQLNHDEIINEIRRRPELRQPPKWR